MGLSNVCYSEALGSLKSFAGAVMAHMTRNVELMKRHTARLRQTWPRPEDICQETRMPYVGYRTGYRHVRRSDLDLLKLGLPSRLELVSGPSPPPDCDAAKIALAGQPCTVLHRAER